MSAVETAGLDKSPATAAQVREWATKKGLSVGARGHLPNDVISAFNKAHRKVVFTSSNPWGKPRKETK